MTASRRHRDEGPSTLPIVVVDLGPDETVALDRRDGGELGRPASRPVSRGLADYVDPHVTDLMQDWHRRFIPAAAPIRPVGFEPVRRTGHPEEILVTLRSRPTVARAIAADVEVFGPGLRRLRVDAATIRRDQRELSWDAVLRAPLWRRRRATLKLFASPSSNVAVLTLTPKRPRRAAGHGFIRAGVRALHDICERIDTVAESRPGVGGGDQPGIEPAPRQNSLPSGSRSTTLR
jgi:hypothetical protein